MNDKRVALVIGNGEYQNADCLRTPSNDAKAIATSLKSCAFEVIEGFNLDRYAMEGALFEFETSLNKADVAFFFYAGHGVRLKDENYLLPVDANIELESHLRRRTIALNEIVEIMASRAKTSLIFLDASRSNPFGDSLAWSIGQKAVRFFGSDLTEILSGRGAFISFAAAGQASDADGIHSPFTTVLLKKLAAPAFNIDDMMTVAVGDVASFTDEKRAPSRRSRLYANFYFGRENTQLNEQAANNDEAKHPRALQPECLANARHKKLVAGAMAASIALLIFQAWPAYENKLKNQAANAMESEQNLSDPVDAQAVKPQQVQLEIANATNLGLVAVSVGRGGRRMAYLKAGGGNEVGQSFRDCEKICPEMVLAPEGKFMMGSAADEPERDYDEGPEHPVSILKPFAVGKYAVTFDEWDACMADGGCNGYRPSDEGWGRGRRPVINVNWNDAQAYVEWLSKKTGKTYRLLSEAEREYVARAGTTTPFWWGGSITTDQANYNGNYVYNGGGDKGEYRAKTVTVNSFAPNPWGLYQVHGNVWEWVQDCHVNNYWDAPTDGRPAKETRGCVRVLRGGSWFIEPRDLRSANRTVLAPTHRDHGIGIRVARTL